MSDRPQRMAGSTNVNDDDDGDDDDDDDEFGGHVRLPGYVPDAPQGGIAETMV